MKVRALKAAKMLPLIIVTLMMISACKLALPEFTLDFSITNAVYYAVGGQTAVTCSLNNIGNGDMTQATVLVRCISGSGSGDEAWTNAVDLSSGESATVTAYISANNPVITNYSIIAAGWDQE